MCSLKVSVINIPDVELHLPVHVAVFALCLTPHRVTSRSLMASLGLLSLERHSEIKIPAILMVIPAVVFAIPTTELTAVNIILTAVDGLL